MAIIFDEVSAEMASERPAPPEQQNLPEKKPESADPEALRRVVVFLARRAARLRAD
jgi:hypothetical protein